MIDKLTSLIFRSEDDPVLTYVNEDGKMVEPEFYAPIIPMILVNGTKGIGTGYSTTIPSYNPKDLINNVRRMMQNKEPKQMIPWHFGFMGTTTEIEAGSYMMHGVYKIMGKDHLHVTELPIGIWWSDYKDYLETLCETMDKKGKSKVPILKDWNSNCIGDKIEFDLYFEDGKLDKLMKEPEKFESKLKLSKKIATTNMHLYNHDCQLRKYGSTEDILKEYFEVRLKYYYKRKKYMIRKLKAELELLKYKVMFIKKKLSGEIKIDNKKRKDIINKLVDLGFPKLAVNPDDDKTYKYITDMPLFALTYEKIEELNRKYKEKKLELDALEKSSEIDLWTSDLDEFEEAYDQWYSDRMEELNDIKNTKLGTEGRKKVTKTKGSKRAKKAPAKRKAPAKKRAPAKRKRAPAKKAIKVQTK